MASTRHGRASARIFLAAALAFVAVGVTGICLVCPLWYGVEAVVWSRSGMPLLDLPGGPPLAVAMAGLAALMVGLAGVAIAEVAFPDRDREPRS